MSAPQQTPPPSTTAMEKPKDPKAERRMTIRSLFEQQRPELTKLLPKSMSLDRLYRLALTECTKNPRLLDCSAESWALAMQTCAAQGLYPDSGLGYMYLIPRQNSKKTDNGWIKVWEVAAQRGYQGDIQLARNSGELTDIYAEVVYAKDAFKVRKGLDRMIEHEPYLGEEDPGVLTHTYAVAKLKSGETAWVVLSKRDVDRHKAAAFGADDEKSPWKKHEAEMWKKTAIHALAKWLPKASENMELLSRSEEQERGQAIDISATTLPMAADRPALEGVKDRLREQQQSEPEISDEPPAEGCDHPDVPPSKLAALPKGKSIVCPGCGEDLPGEAVAAAAAEREPGSDDDIVDEAKKFAEATAKQTSTPRAQRKLAE